MKPFGSIEERHGVNEPDYEPPDDDRPLGRYETVVGALVTPFSLIYRQRAIERESNKVGALEIVGSLALPIAGVVFAMMRFVDNEVGPGLACLLAGIVGWSCWMLALGLA
jgi:hypothetical protein